MQTPMYLLAVLVEQLPQIEAQQQLVYTMAALAPHWKQDSLRAHLRSLEAQAYPDRSYGPALEHIEYNPDLAAEWFASQGYHVVKAS